MAGPTTPEDILAALVSCWCSILADTLGGSPCQCCLISGKPAFPDCTGGVGWVRLVGAYPSVTFPQAQTQPQRCLIDTWSLQIEVGITRCAPQPCDQLGNPCCDAEEAAAAVLLSDFTALRRLWTCGCLGIPSDRMVPGAIRTYGPEGGCQGLVMSATVFASN